MKMFPPPTPLLKFMFISYMHKNALFFLQFFFHFPFFLTILSKQLVFIFSLSLNFLFLFLDKKNEIPLKSHFFALRIKCYGKKVERWRLSLFLYIKKSMRTFLKI